MLTNHEKLSTQIILLQWELLENGNNYSEEAHQLTEDLMEELMDQLVDEC